MGDVWQATDLVLERPVAVKLLRPGFAGQEEDLARFRAEAQHAASLCHPAIARVYDYSETDPPHLVMELVDGPSLAMVLDAGPLDAARTTSIISQAAAGLQAAHTAGLVHRDIKPGNLLVSKTGQVKITDFGIAHAAGSAPITNTGGLIGTPGYLAPERAAGAPATPASDLYALGIVAYQCLTGTLPFEGEPLAVVLAHQQRPMPPLPASVPAPLARLVTDLTAKDPRARPPSAGHVAERAGQLHAAFIGPGGYRPFAPPKAVPGSQQIPLGMAPVTGQNPNGARPPRTKRQRNGAKVLTRAGLALGAVAALGTAGWIVAGISGLKPVHQHPRAPALSQQPGSHRHPARTQDPDAAVVPASPTTRPRTAPATPAPRRARPPTSSRRNRHPAPAPSPSPSASSASPSPTPTPSDTPTPSPTGTSASHGTAPPPPG